MKTTNANIRAATLYVQQSNWSTKPLKTLCCSATCFETEPKSNRIRLFDLKRIEFERLTWNLHLSPPLKKTVSLPPQTTENNKTKTNKQNEGSAKRNRINIFILSISKYGIVFCILPLANVCFSPFPLPSQPYPILFGSKTHTLSFRSIYFNSSIPTPSLPLPTPPLPKTSIAASTIAFFVAKLQPALYSYSSHPVLDSSNPWSLP